MRSIEKMLCRLLLAVTLNGQIAPPAEPLRNFLLDPPPVYATIAIGSQAFLARVQFPPFSSEVEVARVPGISFSAPSAKDGRRNGFDGNGQPKKKNRRRHKTWSAPDLPIHPDPPPQPVNYPPPPPPPIDPFDGERDLDTTDSPYVNIVSTNASPGGRAPEKGNAAFGMRRILVGPSLGALVNSPDRKTIYVHVGGDNTIAVIDRKTSTVTARLPLPAGSQIFPLAISPDGKRLYAGDALQGSAGAYSIDLPSGTATRLSNAGNFITDVCLTPDGTQAWFVSFFGAIQVYETPSNTYAGVVSVTNAYGLDFSPDGTRAYVTAGLPNEPGTVFVYDTATLRRVAAIEVTSEPRHVRVSPTGRHVFVTHDDSEVLTQIDTVANRVIRTIRLGGVAETFTFGRN